MIHDHYIGLAQKPAQMLTQKSTNAIPANTGVVLRSQSTSQQSSLNAVSPQVASIAAHRIGSPGDRCWGKCRRQGEVMNGGWGEQNWRRIVDDVRPRHRSPKCHIWVDQCVWDGRTLTAVAALHSVRTSGTTLP
jgi:hypothetical protein